MASKFVDSDPEPTPSVTQTPPPIHSSPNIVADGSMSYRRKSSQRRNLNKLYDADTTDSAKHIGLLMDGAPTKEHRLLEYFLVISYGDSLQIRDRSPLMDIFENFSKRVHHHHAYIVSPQHRGSRARKRKSSQNIKSRFSTTSLVPTLSLPVHFVRGWTSSCGLVHYPLSIDCISSKSVCRAQGRRRPFSEKQKPWFLEMARSPSIPAPFQTLLPFHFRGYSQR